LIFAQPGAALLQEAADGRIGFQSDRAPIGLVTLDPARIRQASKKS
jgi:hypothetical protein